VFTRQKLLNLVTLVRHYKSELIIDTYFLMFNNLIIVALNLYISIYSVETTYGINSVISKLMTFVENAETGQFLFLIVILSCFTCS
jgi:hypothetical protein